MSMDDIDDTYTRPRQRAPSPAVRLFAVWFMGLIKGAVLSAFTLLPFFGPWAMAAGTLAFSLFCLGMALKRLPEAGEGGASAGCIENPGSCTPKVRR